MTFKPTNRIRERKYPIHCNTLWFVNFKDKFIPVVWRSTILTLDVKHLEESNQGFTKNWRSEEEHSEKLIHEVEELKRASGNAT